MNDITTVITGFYGYIHDLVDFLDTAVVFRAFGVDVSLWNLFIAFMILGFVISAFWKGAKS